MPIRSGRYRSYGPPPPLPDPETLPFPGSLVRTCKDCNLGDKCRAPVPGENVDPSVNILLVGQNPGKAEDQNGRPFIGAAGEYLDSLLFQARVPRDTVSITNVVKCLTPGNRIPSPAEIKACSKWLDLEVEAIDPYIIVAMGGPAIVHFLGTGAGSVEQLNGKPVWLDGRVILPMFHPAAALHDTSKLRHCSEAFDVLRELVNGATWRAFHVRDEYPNPEYRVADTPELLRKMRSEVLGPKEFGLDTEQCHGKPWSYQVSAQPGTAWFVPLPDNFKGRIDFTDWPATAIMHYYLHDIDYVDVRDDDFIDTMVLAYLCVARDTPILKADLTWGRADEIKVGDELVGFDENYKTRSRSDHRSYPRRKLRRSVVNHASVHPAECFRVELADGRSVTCTGDHLWLVNRVGTARTEWLATTEVMKRMRTGMYRVRAITSGTWNTADSYDAGWLAGILDGEGTVRGKDAAGAQVCITQKPGAVLDKVDSLTCRMGFRYTNKIYKDNSVSSVVISSIPQAMHLLGSVRPVRFSLDFWEGKDLPSSHTVGNFATIESIKAAGDHDVVAVNTTTGTYVANGLASHNCGAPQGLKELAHRLCGIQMQSYNDVVRPGQQILCLEYLDKALKQEWPDPPLIEETKWDNRKGEIVTRQKKPWHIARKMNRMLGDLEKDPEVDLWGRWRGIPAEERAVAESVLGIMPESSLTDIPFELAVEYACRDADATLRVCHKLMKIIDKLGLSFVQYVDLGILPMVKDMMRNGMAVDLDHYRRLSEDYDLRMRVKAAELAAQVGHSFNPNSPPQVATVMYEELGFRPTRFTTTGLISTDDAELKKTGHPVAQSIIQYRGIQKLKSTYADNMIVSAYPDGAGTPRIHTVLKTTRVETGRLSSAKAEDGTGANLQNIPTRNKEAKAIKNGFVVPDGWLMAEGDYAQVEMCTQAHLANCNGLIELFNRGGDPHTETAARLFGVPLEEAAKDKYRYPCKRAGFGIIYMIGPHGLSTQINEYIADLVMDGEPVDVDPWDEETCGTFIAEYYKLYPEIRVYQRTQLAMARRHGYVQDMFGRIRYIPEVNCPIRTIQEAGARMAANFAVTASAQGILKLAMVELWDQLPQTEWADAKALMQIHDSLIYELRDDEGYLHGFLTWMHNVMTGVVRLRVPIKVDFKIGKRWGELEKYNGSE